MSARNPHPTSRVVLPDERSIRLLHLQPAVHPDDPIVCELTTTSSSSPVSYEALSYTCGPPVFDYTLDDQTIWLCGTKQEVTGNLFDALKQFRQSSATRVLWVDALCIDQDDPIEKASQVSRMHEVYKHAVRVLLWLGNDCEAFDGELCLAFFRQFLTSHDEEPLVDEMQPIFGYDEEDEEVGSNTELEARLQQIAAALDSTLVSKALKHTFHVSNVYNVERLQDSRPSAVMSSIVGSWVCTWRRRYFARRWIIQELLNAPEVLLHCGGSSMPWPDYRRACTLVQRVWLNLGWYGTGEDNAYDVTLRGRQQDHSTRLFRLEEHDGVQDPMFELLFVESELRDERREDEEIAQLSPSQRPVEVSGEECILRLLYLFRDFECGDPRDRIYALLGAMSRQLSVNFRPDYTIDMIGCFTRFAGAMVQGGSSMRVLNQAMHQIRVQGFTTSRPLRDPGLPSWVPDWRTRVSHDVTTFYAEDQEYMQQAPVVEPDGSLLLTSVSLGICCERCYARITLTGGEPGNLVCEGESVLLSRKSQLQTYWEGIGLMPVPERTGSYRIIGERCWMRVDRDRDCWCVKPVMKDIRVM